jgi:16S rRNA processing protein RimM
MKTEANSLVVMGRIVAPYGVQGWLKVLPDTEALDGLLDYETWQIGKEGNWQEVKLEAGKVHNDVLVVKLTGIDDRDVAFACKGMQIAVPRAVLPELNESEYYWSDLIGLAVTNQQGVYFGKITNVFDTGANDVIVVNGESERLIPFAEHTVIAVDIAQQTMLVDWDEDY